jgi:iron complex outermembrane receptor protein
MKICFRTAIFKIQLTHFLFLFDNPKSLLMIGVNTSVRKGVFLLFSFIFSLAAFAQNTTVRGTVKDPNGLPLQGASVVIEGTKKGVVTDINGAYSISVAPGTYTLVITYVGMQQQKQPVDVPAAGLSDVSSNLQSAGDLNRIVIVGSRSATVRSSTQTPVPVDVISARELQATGQVEPTQMLNFIAPSYNSSRQTVADGTDHIDPATLRGLGPDQVLVLVNGKRRYNTALLNVNGTIGRGSVGTDLNSIPPEAIERIEVLRDGASSQYGSDAIGGVINVVMKKNNKGTTLFAHAGQYYAGDGGVRQIGLTQGFKLGSEGFLSISGDLRHRDATNRVGDYQGNVYNALPNNYTPGQFDSVMAIDIPFSAQKGFNRKNNMAIGNSQLDNGGFLINAGIPLSGRTQFFATASMNWRDGKAAGFYRYPYQTGQVITALYPDGFLPLINSIIKDKSFIVGVQGKMAGGWNWDASQTGGGNSFRFDITNTNNATQFALGKAAQTEFYAGTLVFNQYTTNVNFSKDMGAKMGLKSFNFATGAELRFDNYQIQAGEEASWKNYDPTSGKVGGAQVFSGFQPVNAVNETRTVGAAYVDVESDITDRFLANVAARFESYSDFGSNIAGKLALRYKAADALSFRGSVSNGFRAPSMHQRYFSSVATVFVSVNGVLTPVQNGTFRNNSELAKAFGLPSLEAEKSMNYSVGLTSRLTGGWNFTVDAYQIDIKDRIVLTGIFRKTSTVVASLLAAYPDVNTAAFFSNAIDTRTKGLDVVISKDTRMDKGSLRATLAANFNKTKVTKNKDLPAPLKADPTLGNVLFDREQKSRVEEAQPRNKISLGLNYLIGKFSVNARSTRFGEVATKDITNPLLDEEFDPRVITDLSIGYKISNFATLTIGANNIGDVYPEKLKKIDYRNRLDNSSFGRFVYSRAATQFGFNGGYYFTSLVFDIGNL